MIEALRKDLRRLKGDLEEGEQEEEIVEIETKEEDSGAAENVAENSALEVCQTVLFSPLSIYNRIIFSNENILKKKKNIKKKKKNERESLSQDEIRSEIEFDDFINRGKLGKEQQFLSMDALIREVSAVQRLKKALNRDVIGWEEWKANTKRAAAEAHIEPEMWYKAGERGEEYRSLALLAALKLEERYYFSAAKTFFLTLTYDRSENIDKVKIWNGLHGKII